MRPTCLSLILLLTTFSFARAQESDQGKKLWAKSVINQKAPDLVVEKWLTEAPNTTGKFVLIDFWATWCGPCRTFIPLLNEMSARHPDDLVVIGISDQPADVVEAFQGFKPKYYEAVDTKKTMATQLQVVGIPHVILIDPKGIVRWEGYPLLDNYQLTDAVLSGLISKYKSS